MNEKLLFITDLFDFKEHSFIDGMINVYLRDFFEVEIVYFSKTSLEIKRKKNKILIPYKDKKRIDSFLNMKEYNFLIIRNDFRVLSSLLKYKNFLKIGFQNSFPHSFRRVFEAKQMNKAIVRKSIEYFFKSKYENYLINKVDFFLPISKEMLSSFYSKVYIPTFILPLGIEESDIVKKEYIDHDTLKMIYIGTIDKLRNFEFTIDCLSNISSNIKWSLDIYSSSSILVPEKIKDKVVHKDFIKRGELLKKISTYDLGLFLIPVNDLYKVSSPTKVMEYYQSSIPCLTTKVPECLELFSQDSAFLVDFDKKQVVNELENILNMNKRKLFEMGIKGQNNLIKYRNYNKMAKDLKNFLIRIGVNK